MTRWRKTPNIRSKRLHRIGAEQRAEHRLVRAMRLEVELGNTAVPTAWGAQLENGDLRSSAATQVPHPDCLEVAREPGGSLPPGPTAGCGGLSRRTLSSLLARRLVRLRGVLGVRQHLAELVLSEQLVGFQLLEGAGAADRDAPVVGPEHPVCGLQGSVHRVEQLPYRSGPVAWALDHPGPCVA